MQNEKNKKLTLFRLPKDFQNFLEDFKYNHDCYHGSDYVHHKSLGSNVI